MGHAFQLCALDHPDKCTERRTVYDIHSTTAISTATAEKQQAFKDQVDDFMRNFGNMLVIFLEQSSRVITTGTEPLVFGDM